jgi:hypothetical protein
MWRGLQHGSRVTSVDRSAAAGVPLQPAELLQAASGILAHRPARRATLSLSDHRREGDDDGDTDREGALGLE